MYTSINLNKRKLSQSRSISYLQFHCSISYLLWNYAKLKQLYFIQIKIYQINTSFFRSDLLVYEIKKYNNFKNNGTISLEKI